MKERQVNLQIQEYLILYALNIKRKNTQTYLNSENYNHIVQWTSSM